MFFTNYDIIDKFSKMIFLGPSYEVFKNRGQYGGALQTTLKRPETLELYHQEDEQFKKNVQIIYGYFSNQLHIFIKLHSMAQGGLQNHLRSQDSSDDDNHLKAAFKGYVEQDKFTLSIHQELVVLISNIILLIKRTTDSLNVLLSYKNDEELWWNLDRVGKRWQALRGHVSRDSRLVVEAINKFKLEIEEYKKTEAELIRVEKELENL